MEEEIVEKGKEKVFITRDSDDNFVWVWRKPTKGSWEPVNISTNSKINWQRTDRSLENADFYHCFDFERKFGFPIKRGEKLNKKILIKLLDNDDFKEISDNPRRKISYILN